MKVMLLTAGPGPGQTGGTGIDHCAYDKLLECARQDRFGEHSLTNDPVVADIILFAELGFSTAMGFFDSRLRRHPLVRRYRSKCFVFNTADIAVPYLPGVYPSVEQRWYDPRRVRSGHYLSSHTAVPPLLPRESRQRDLLFSFVGTADNHPVRRRIVALNHPRGLCRDVSEESRRVWTAGPGAVARYLAEYAEIMSRSQFALCPRGVGTSSIRLFESMRQGVVPVIISDEWVPPTGPDWKTFSLRLPESDVEALPSFLQAHESRSEEMGKRARSAWEEWFSDEVSFHRIVNWCREIMDTRAGDGDPTLGRMRAAAQSLHPVQLRAQIGTLRSRLAI